MAATTTLRRVLRLRRLAEQQSQLALDAALAELRRLEQALDAADGRQQSARLLMAASAHSGLLADRWAGLEESRSAERHARALAARAEGAEEEVARLRGAMLEHRIERRQAETLVAEASAREAVEAERRAQQQLDDRFATRLHARRRGR